MKVTVIIEKDEFGYYAYCPELKGCHTQGDTLDEVLKNIREAVELYLETFFLLPFHSRKVLHPKIVKQLLELIGKDRENNLSK